MNFIWDIHVNSFPASTEASFSLYWAGKEASANREVPSIFYSFKIQIQISLGTTVTLEK